MNTNLMQVISEWFRSNRPVNFELTRPEGRWSLTFIEIASADSFQNRISPFTCTEVQLNGVVQVGFEQFVNANI